MKQEDILHSDVIDYFTGEFASLKERLKAGRLEGYRERVVVSRKIAEAVHLLAPYVRSDPRARHLVKSAETLKKDLLSVKSIIEKQLLQQKDQQTLLQAIGSKRKKARQSDEATS